MLLSFVIMVLLMASTPKLIPWEWGKNQVTREIVPVWQYYSQPGTARSSAYLVPLLFRHARIFGNYLPNSPFLCPADLQSFEQSTNHYYIPPAWCWPQSCLLKATWIHLSPPRNPLWTFCATQKHMCTTWCHFCTLAEAFQELIMEFSPTEPKISYLFIHQSS